MRWSYIFLHWGSTILLAALLLPIFGGFENNVIFKDLWRFPFILIGGIILSLPTLFAYILVFFVLNHYKMHIKWVKPILISLTVIGICLTYYQLSKTLNLMFVLIYSGIAVGCGLLFKVGKK
ncbi:hypothetical protein ABTW24_24470 [Sphingobacterium thalpophilum]|uniref:Uncharacterized protein n=1 Tax=Sphingobacterium thalpophilum TaxID=259 RepID=A0ABV4HJP9_9SPHI